MENTFEDKSENFIGLGLLSRTAMGHRISKITKFAALGQMDNVIQPSSQELRQDRFAFKGNWHKTVFGNSHPLILEIGCGKGEYTLALAERFPDCNFIGLEFKGNRLWFGAQAGLTRKLHNAFFLRSSADFLTALFGKGEVAEIWIPFPDPRYERPRRSLVSEFFQARYRQILKSPGIVHLKTDCGSVINIARNVALAAGGCILEDCQAVTGSNFQEALSDVISHYEQRCREKGKTIRYLRFSPA